MKQGSPCCAPIRGGRLWGGVVEMDSAPSAFTVSGLSKVSGSFLVSRDRL